MDQLLQLRVDGLVATPRSFSFMDLRAFPETEQVRDFTRYHPKRPGDGVTLRSLLDRVHPASDANYLTLHATHDDFAASIPLAAILDEAVVVYQLDGAAYPESREDRSGFSSRTRRSVTPMNSTTAPT